MSNTTRSHCNLRPTDRRTFLRQVSSAAMALGAASAAQADQKQTSAEQTTEWRNKHSPMAYRRLGRTGLMISEVISGGDPIRQDNYQHLDVAIEMGLNYLDMAPSYGRGDCETAYGKLLAGSSRRQRVFLATKISRFTNVRDRLYKEVFDGLPSAKQEKIVAQARAMRLARGVDKPGYFLEYYPGQGRQFGPAYLSNAMMRDYAHQVDDSPQFRQFITRSVEGSLKRIGTDYVDILMCPHGACTPEELRIAAIEATFQELKKQGKVRFLGVTSHNDPAGILRQATALGHYDVVMMAYNVINGGYLEEAIRQAAEKDVGIIAMKVAHAVATHHRSLQPIPKWRVDKVQRIVPGDMKPPMKAYLWALQNPHVAAVISNLWDENFVRENLSLAGKKVQLQPA